MRIGIDARAATEVAAGRGRYVRELLSSLAKLDDRHTYRLYSRRPWTAGNLDERFEWQLDRWPDPLWHLRTGRRASRECDVYLSTNSYLTTWFTAVPAVAVIFDMVAFDQRFKPRGRSRWIEPATLGRAVKRCSSLLAISDSTRADLVERFPAATDKVEVVELAADDSFSPQSSDDATVLRRHGLEHPYVLATGTIEPRKNLPRLIDAFCGLPHELPSTHELVLVGGQGWSAEQTLEHASRNADRVRMLGHVPDSDLPALYRGATVFCYPSLYEGFGLPVLESMSCATPVITSNISSLPEVGGDAARYVDPTEVDDIRLALTELLSDADLRAALVRKGVERAKRYSWTETAQRTLDALVQAARSR